MCGVISRLGITSPSGVIRVSDTGNNREPRADIRKLLSSRFQIAETQAGSARHQVAVSSATPKPAGISTKEWRMRSA